MESDIKSYAKITTRKTERELKLFLSKWCAYSKSLSPQLYELTKLFKQHTIGGKMLRGSLVTLGYEINTTNKNNDIYKIAAAFEIVHTSLLIHDDIIDKSATRRNRPTVYKKLGGDHYAISQAICLGDMGFFLANQLINQSTFNPIMRTNISKMFSEMLLNTILGEMIDVNLSLPKAKHKESDIILMQKMKTAYYTIVWPLTIGAVLGGAKQPQLTAIKSFGESLGIAFQIHDDILGVFGDEKQLGKSVTSDIAEGKNTLLIAYAKEHASSNQKKLLQQYYGNSSVTNATHEIIKKIFIETGALHYSQMQAAEYVKHGKKFIPQITKLIVFQKYFFTFADYLITRRN